MDLKVAFVIVCLCALAITISEAGIPKCCIKTKKSISKEMWRKVYKVVQQSSGGACEIDAQVLYMRNEKIPLCLSPEIKLPPRGKPFSPKKFSRVK